MRQICSDCMSDLQEVREVLLKAESVPDAYKPAFDWAASQSTVILKKHIATAQEKKAAEAPEQEPTVGGGDN